MPSPKGAVMTYTYEKRGNYFIINGNENSRVYTDANPEDYIEDLINQEKRSASAWYKEVHTGKEVTWDEIADYDHDGSKPGNGFVWYGSADHEFDKRENYTWEGGFSFKFERKVPGLATFGSNGRSATYESKYKTEAWAFVNGKTIEEQREIERMSRERMDDFNRRHPWLYNLHDRLGYLDDNGNQITFEEHREMVKKKYGDDVFEKADAELQKKFDADPVLKKAVDEIVQARMDRLENAGKQ